MSLVISASVLGSDQTSCTVVGPRHVRLCHAELCLVRGGPADLSALSGHAVSAVVSSFDSDHGQRHEDLSVATVHVRGFPIGLSQDL